MEKKEVVLLLSEIDNCYPGKLKLEPSTVDSWYRYMKNQSYDNVMKRFDKYVTENKFPPSVADLYVKDRPERRKDYLEKIKGWEAQASGVPKS